MIVTRSARPTDSSAAEAQRSSKRRNMIAAAGGSNKLLFLACIIFHGGAVVTTTTRSQKTHHDEQEEQAATTPPIPSARCYRLLFLGLLVPPPAGAAAASASRTLLVVAAAGVGAFPGEAEDQSHPSRPVPPPAQHSRIRPRRRHHAPPSVVVHHRLRTTACKSSPGCSPSWMLQSMAFLTPGASVSSASRTIVTRSTCERQRHEPAGEEAVETTQKWAGEKKKTSRTWSKGGRLFGCSAARSAP